MFVFDQSHARPNNSIGNEVVLRFCFLDNLNDFAGLLVKRLHCGQKIAVVQHFGFGQNTLGAVLVDVEAKDFSTEFGVYDDLSAANGSAVADCGLSSGGAAQTEHHRRNDAAYQTI